MELTQKSFEVIKPRFVELVDEKTFSKEVSFALQAMKKNPQLLKCDKNTIISAVLNVAQFGLTLNPIQQQAYLVPFFNRASKQYECVLMAGYQGLIAKITEAGAVRNIISEIVYDSDDFKVIQGTNPSIIHNPRPVPEMKPVAAYAVAFFKEGGYQFEVMQWDEVEKVRATSLSYKSMGEKSIWGLWENEMAKKTVIRRLAKRLPKNGDEGVRELTRLDDKDFMPDWTTVQYAETLLRNCNWDSETVASIEKQLFEMNLADIQNLIVALQNDQQTIFEKGVHGTQTALAKDLARLSNDNSRKGANNG